jgi:hypothetical protein
MSLEYTKSEIQLLNSMLTEKSLPTIGKQYTSPSILDKNNITLYNKTLDTETSLMLKEYEPYGEGRSFSIRLVRSSIYIYEFIFTLRHLNYFLYKTTLEEMPLFIDTFFMKDLANWRLLIAK